MDWKNITSYSQGETDRTPRTWEARIGKIRLVVTRKWEGKWSGWHVEAEPFLRYKPEGGDVEEIKTAAVRALHEELTKHAKLTPLPESDRTDK